LLERRIEKSRQQYRLRTTQIVQALSLDCQRMCLRDQTHVDLPRSRHVVLRSLMMT
jgi:hypothetical protein